MPKKKEIIITKGSAYIYLKSLLTLSEDFKEDVFKIREKYKIQLPEAPKPKSGESSDAFALRELQHFEFIQNDLKSYIETPEFKKLCEKFFIPTEFNAKINRYLYTNNSSDVLGHVVRSKIIPTGYEVPYIEMQFPFYISQEDYKKAWKIFKERQSSLLRNKGKNKPVYHLWKNVKMSESKPFDRALCAYRLSKKYKDITKIIGNLLKKGKISKAEAETLHGNKEVYSWISKIEVQVKSLENLRELNEKELI